MFLLSPLFGGYEDGVKWMGKMNRNCYQNQSNAFGTWERGQCSTPCSRQLNWPWIMFVAVLKQILRFSVFFPHMCLSVHGISWSLFVYLYLSHLLMRLVFLILVWLILQKLILKNLLPTTRTRIFLEMQLWIYDHQNSHNQIH